MRRFAMCAACRAEYRSPEDRRFHAEPVACGRCGPRAVLRDRDGREQARGAEALAAAIESDSRREGGGHQGARRVPAPRPRRSVRAGRPPPRGRDGRPSRWRSWWRPSRTPHAWAWSARSSVACSTSPENPIVLLERRPARRDVREIAPEVAPRLSSLGVFLPTTPLHHLLLAGLDFPVVATSGNRGEEPIVTDEWDVCEQLGGIADAFLDHDRPIVRGVDDSVVRVIAGRPVTLRLARGHAPLPLPSIERLAGSGTAPLLATGGHQKVAVAFWSGTQAVLAQHAGDMDGASSPGGLRTARGGPLIAVRLRARRPGLRPAPRLLHHALGRRAGEGRSSRCSITTPMRWRAWSSTGCSTARCWP